MTLKYFKGQFSLGCHFHVHFSNPWHAIASHGLPAIAELLVIFIATIATIETATDLLRSPVFIGTACTYSSCTGLYNSYCNHYGRRDGRLLLSAVDCDFHFMAWLSQVAEIRRPNCAFR